MFLRSRRVLNAKSIIPSSSSWWKRTHWLSVCSQSCPRIVHHFVVIRLCIGSFIAYFTDTFSNHFSHQIENSIVRGRENNTKCQKLPSKFSLFHLLCSLLSYRLTMTRLINNLVSVRLRQVCIWWLNMYVCVCASECLYLWSKWVECLKHANRVLSELSHSHKINLTSDWIITVNMLMHCWCHFWFNLSLFWIYYDYYYQEKQLAISIFARKSLRW